MKKAILLSAFLLIQSSCLTKKLMKFVNEYKTQLLKEISHYGLQDGDTLVDIGCGWGHIDALIATHYPNIHFRLEDIHNFEFDIIRMFRKITGFSTEEIVSKVKMNVGTEKTIPYQKKYRKILCRVTLHEFKYRDEMAKEMTRILAPDGRLIIVEPVASAPGHIKPDCGKPVLTKSEIENTFFTCGLSLHSFEELPGPSWPTGIFVFTFPPGGE